MAYHSVFISFNLCMHTLIPIRHLICLLGRRLHLPVSSLVYSSASVLCSNLNVIDLLQLGRPHRPSSQLFPDLVYTRMQHMRCPRLASLQCRSVHFPPRQFLQLGRRPLQQLGPPPAPGNATQRLSCSVDTQAKLTTLKSFIDSLVNYQRMHAAIN